MNNTMLYTTRGGSYESARPGYPKALIDYLYKDQKFSGANAIADVGSGTGKFTQLLLESAANQSYQKLEILVIDDGSTGGSEEPGIISQEGIKWDEEDNYYHK